jgi:hypothetical protein
MNWKAWLQGLTAAAINSAAAVGATIIVDIEHASDPGKLAATIGVGAATGALLYLKQSPLPPANTRRPKKKSMEIGGNE